MKKCAWLLIIFMFFFSMRAAGELLVDDFDDPARYDSKDNALFAWTDGSASVTDVVAGGSLSLTWNASGSWWESVLDPSITCFNASAFTCIQFDIKTSMPSVDFRVVASYFDAACTGVSRAHVFASEYVSPGPAWTTVTIPLSDYKDNPLDITRMRGINFDNFYPSSGSIEIDNLKLVNIPVGIRVSGYDLMPASVSTGQQDAYALMLKISNPSAGTAVIKGLTLTVKDGLSNTILASSALSVFGIKDESVYFFNTASIPPSPYIYCPVPSGIQVGPYSEKNVYAVMDITGNTINHAVDFQISLDSPSNIRLEDFSTGNTLPVMAGPGFLFPMDSYPAVIHNRATELSISGIDTMPVSVSTGQSDVMAMKFVFTDIGDTMTASIKVSRISLEVQDSAGNPIQASTAVKNIRVTGADGAFIYGQAAAGTASKLIILLSAPLIVPSTQDFTCAIMLDMADSLSAGSGMVSLKLQDDLYAVDANSSDPVLVTSLTSFPKSSDPVVIEEKADSINVSAFTPLLSADVVKGQKWAELFSFQLSDSLGIQSAQALFNGLTISVKNSTGAPSPANGVVEKFYITDSSGTTLGSVSAGVATDTYIPLSSASVFSSGVSKTFRVFADIITTAYSPDFMASLQSSNIFSVTDNNSGYEAAKIAAGMPWDTAAVQVFDAPATDLRVWHNGNVAPTLAGMAQPDVKFMSLYMSNPGFIGTADVMVSGITLTVVDEGDNIVAPSNLLEKIYVTNLSGDAVYADFYSLTQTAAAPFYVPFLSPVYVDALNTKSAYVSGDIATYASLGTYRLRVAAAGYIDGKSVPLGTVAVSAAAPDFFPMDSNPVTITALAYDFKVGHTDLMPVSVAKGAQGVNALRLNFRNYNALPIAVTKAALAVKRCDGTGMLPADVMTGGVLVDKDGNTITNMVSASGAFLSQNMNFQIPSGAEREITVRVNLRADTSVPFYIELISGTGISTLPLASVNPADSDYFGNMKSGCVSIQSNNIEGSFHAFPNPFDPEAGSAAVEYYLEADSEVTIKIYTMNGNLVRTITDKKVKTAGLHYEDTWDGKNAAGKSVKSGVYLCVMEAAGRKLSRKLAVLR